MMKTDLKKILSISGQSGLFTYVSQANAGVIVEALNETKKRSCFGISARMSSLADISVYAKDEEVSLQTVLENMKSYLNSEEAINSKSKPEELKAFFEQVLPDYDKDRFYISHMKKIIDWYNILRIYSTLEFLTDEDRKDDSTQESPTN